MKSLKSIRSAYGLTQVYFSKSLGVTQGFYSQVEQGNKYPTFDMMVRLKVLYNIDCNELIELYKNVNKHAQHSVKD